MMYRRGGLIGVETKTEDRILVERQAVNLVGSTRRGSSYADICFLCSSNHQRLQPSNRTEITHGHLGGRKQLVEFQP